MRRPLGRTRRREDADPIWVVTVDYAGARFRWASRLPGWDVLDVDGLPVAFVGSWTPPQAIDMAADTTIPVEVIFPDNTRIARAELGGVVTLSGCPVEVAWLPANGTWASRNIVSSGYVDGPEIGVDLEPVSFGIIARSQLPDTAVIPGPTHAVTSLSWPTYMVAGNPDSGAVESAQGRSYPVVYGAPGPFRFGGGTIYGHGSKTLIVDSETVSIGTPSTPTRLAKRILVNSSPISTMDVYLRWQEGSNSHWFRAAYPVVVSEDGIDQRCATIDLSGESDTMRSASEYWVCWKDGAADGRTGADEIALWFLEQSTGVDMLRSRSGIAALRGLKLGGYINDPTSPRDWIADRLAEFPVELVDGSAGMYLSAVPWQADASIAVAHIAAVEAPNGLALSGAIRISPLRVEAAKASTVRIAWAPSNEGTGRMVTMLTSDGVIDTSTTVVAASAPPSNDGVKVAGFELPDVWDEATAAYIARYVWWRECRPRREVRISVPTDAWAWLTVGDVITYSDDGLGVSNMVAYVASIALTVDSMMEIVLRFP